METTNSNDPMVHTSHVKGMLTGLIDHLRDDVLKLDDPAAKALFEVSAEVLIGLKKAFEDFEKKEEAAWKK